MSITNLMSEICNLAYLIVENIVEEQYDRRHGGGAAKIHRRKNAQRPQRSRENFKYVAGPPGPPQRT